MRIKSFLVAMSVLGLISQVGFAETVTNDTKTPDTTAVKTDTQTALPEAAATTETTTTTPISADATEATEPSVEATKTETTTKPSVHHYKHRHVASKASKYKDYKDFKDICSLSKQSVIWERSTQNTDRSLPNPCNPGWFNRINFSGGINFDTGKWGNRNVGNSPVVGSSGAGYAGENTDRFSLNDAYLNVAISMTDWINAFTSISYLNTSNFYSMAYNTTPNSVIINDNNGKLNVQQAFMHVGNFDYSPVYVELGQQFQDYGRYELHPITESMTQALTETLRTSLKVGMLTPGGFTGSAYIFQDPIGKNVGGSKPYNYGANIGLEQPDEVFGYDIGLGYLYNMQGINLVGNTSAYSAGVQGTSGVYTLRVDSAALYGDVNYHAFALALRYTKALTTFSPLDAPLDNVHPTQGAKPWAASAQGSYAFNRWSKDQNVFLGYQVSRQTIHFNLPRARFAAGYGINVLPNTKIGAEWDHDIAYPVADGGPTEGNSNLVSLRVAVAFG